MKTDQTDEHAAADAFDGWPNWKKAAAAQAFERMSDDAKRLARLRYQVHGWAKIMADQLGCEPHILDIAQAIPVLLGDLDKLRDEVARLKAERANQGGVSPGSE